MTPLFAIGLAMALAQSPAPTRAVTFEGCVTPGVDRGSYVITNVVQSPTQEVLIPESAHGRRVLFWLDNDAAVRTNIGRKVEITGRFTEVEESEIELKAGRQSTGGFVVEFEGPGRDVRSANPSVATAVGTSGQTTPERNDLKTFLMRVSVTNVRALAGSCN